MNVSYRRTGLTVSRHLAVSVAHTDRIIQYKCIAIQYGGLCTIFGRGICNQVWSVDVRSGEQMRRRYTNSVDLTAVLQEITSPSPSFARRGVDRCALPPLEKGGLRGVAGANYFLDGATFLAGATFFVGFG
jgi:hypothetical protein